jgi:putative ABC transport system permease protein
VWSISLRTLRDRWTLFVGALLSVALGVALVQSSTVLLLAAGRARPAAGSDPAQARVVRDTADGLSSLMGISIFLALFLTVFIIGSTMAFTVVERRRDLALLRLNGASKRQVRRLLVGEGLLVGLVGTAVGALLGLLTTAVETWLVGRVGLDAALLHVGFPGWTLLVDLGAGLGSALAGVLVASRRAGRIRPLEALRDGDEQRRVMTLGRWVWGLLFGIPALGGAVLAQASGDVLVAVMSGLLVIVAGSVALQQLSPLVVPLAARAYALPARRHVVGELAQAGMRDGVRRTATTAGPVIVLFGLVVGLLGILATQTEAGRVERIQQSSAQLVVVSHGDVTARIRATPGVLVASPETEVDLPVQVLTRTGHWARVEAPAVTAVDPAPYRSLTHVRVRDGSPSEFAAGRAMLGPAAGDDGLGDPRAVRVGGSRLPVVARLGSTISDAPDVLVDRHDVPAAVLEDTPTTTFVGLDPGASVPDVRRRLAVVGTVSSLPQWASSLAHQQADENNGVMAALAGLGGLYAFLSLVNAVAIGTAQRRREFAVARVTGASRRQVIAVAAFEALGVAAIGVALGTAVAAACLLGLRHGIAGTLGVAVLEVPWRAGLLLAVAALAAAAGTAAVAACSATRTPPVRLVAARE